MEQKVIKILVLTNNQIIISQIEEVVSELGEPDCKLNKPYEIRKSVDSQIYLEPWNLDYTLQDVFMISSDKILTLADPKPTILENYQTLIK